MKEPARKGRGDFGFFWRRKVEGAKVTATDIMCSNGVVRVIDTVILPPSL